MKHTFRIVPQFGKTPQAIAYPKNWQSRGTGALWEIACDENISEAVREFLPVLIVLGSSLEDISRTGPGILT